MNIKYEKNCPMCGTTSTIELTDEEARGVRKYLTQRCLIQEALPALRPSEREFIVTGYCPDCQNLLFGCENSKTDKFYVQEAV